MLSETPGAPFHDRPLRVGLLVNSLSQRAWIHKIIQAVNESGVAEVVLVIRSAPGSDTEPGSKPAHTSIQQRKSPWRWLLDNRRHLLYEAYRRLDRWRFPYQPDAFAESDLSPLLGGCPVIDVAPRRTRYSDYFNKDDFAAIKAYDLDVALRFGFRILRGRALRIARYGVWSYHHGDNLVNRGAPPALWEVLEDHPVTGAILQILSEDLDGGQVLYRSYSPTHKISWHQNQQRLYWRATHFVPRVLADLHQHGPAALDRDPVAEEYRPYTARLYQKPRSEEMVRPLLRLARTYLRLKLGGQPVDHWFVAYRIKARAHGSSDAFYKFKELTPPPDRFWADPFPVAHEGRYFLFVEEYIYATQLGHIAVIEVDKDGMVGQPVTVLKQEIHLSYPFVFRWQGSYYMIPETAKRGTIELYRCTQFPDQWELAQVMMENIEAKDATLAEIDGRWWLFANLKTPEGPLDEDLYLFYAPSPLGPWTPHQFNPVKSDIRSARPAGHLFRWGGRLYRPAQNSARRYGHGITINEIITLTPKAFYEREAGHISADWQPGILGTHTLNNDGDLTVIDGVRRR